MIPDANGGTRRPDPGRVPPDPLRVATLLLALAVAVAGCAGGDDGPDFNAIGDAQLERLLDSPISAPLEIPELELFLRSNPDAGGVCGAGQLFEGLRYCETRIYYLYEPTAGSTEKEALDAAAAAVSALGATLIDSTDTERILEIELEADNVTIRLVSSGGGSEFVHEVTVDLGRESDAVG